jgi:hypothetical protein
MRKSVRRAPVPVHDRRRTSTQTCSGDEAARFQPPVGASVDEPLSEPLLEPPSVVAVAAAQVM